MFRQNRSCLLPSDSWICQLPTTFVLCYFPANLMQTNIRALSRQLHEMPTLVFQTTENESPFHALHKETEVDECRSNWGCYTVILAATADVANLMMVLVDEIFRNTNTDPTTKWKVTRKEQDPTLAYFSIEGVVWVGVGINQCPFLPLLGGSWKWKFNVTFSTCLAPKHSRTRLKSCAPNVLWRARLD